MVILASFYGESSSTVLGCLEFLKQGVGKAEKDAIALIKFWRYQGVNDTFVASVVRYFLIRLNLNN